MWRLNRRFTRLLFPTHDVIFFWIFVNLILHYYSSIITITNSYSLLATATSSYLGYYLLYSYFIWKVIWIYFLTSQPLKKYLKIVNFSGRNYLLLEAFFSSSKKS